MGPAREHDWPGSREARISAISPLLRGKQTFGEPPENHAHDPKRKCAVKLPMFGQLNRSSRNWATNWRTCINGFSVLVVERPFNDDMALRLGS